MKNGVLPITFLANLPPFKTAGWAIDCFISPSASSPLVPAHSTILSNASPFFRDAMTSKKFRESRTIELGLRSENAHRSVEILIRYIYTGRFEMNGATAEQMLQLAEQTRMLHLSHEITQLQQNAKNHIFPGLPPLWPTMSMLNSVQNPPLFSGLDLSALNLQVQALQAEYLQQAIQQLCASVLPTASTAPIPTSVIETAPSVSNESPRRRRLQSESAAMKRQASMEDDHETLIASSDKEGWCRNKKYIEKAEKGFMCMLCGKEYGRYNSVSYHVTIYHRNPPIRCDMPDCQFATREARYIHFHKYYRHGVPLPESIDQGSRKCPYCKHVSKSPAMLEKHIRRHLTRSSATTPIECAEAGEYRPRTVSELPLDVDVVREETEEEHNDAADVIERQEETKPRAFTL